MAFVYVLKCCDGSYYVDSTVDYRQRLFKHQSGSVKYTKSRLPAKLVFLKQFTTYSQALLFEKRVKSWKKRLSIEKMFDKNDNLARLGPIV